VWIYEEQQQVITVGIDRSVAVWDAYRLERMQIIKDVQVNGVITNAAGITGHVAPKFKSSAFDPQGGMLFTACQAIKLWQAQVDGKVKIKALQVETLSKALLKERSVTDEAHP
jgi:hypothetical protein